MVKIQVNNQGKAYITSNNKVLLAPGESKKYTLLQRIKDDSNNEIGTVSGFFKDSNDVEYAVVCLDSQYRLADGVYCSSNNYITNLQIVSDWRMWDWKDTATSNTQLILDYCSSVDATSSSCSHCRSLSFSIDGNVYSGQLPNIVELYDIAKNHTSINNLDTTAASYNMLNFSNSRKMWSSSQFGMTTAWAIDSTAAVTFFTKSQGNILVTPVLEIPNI